MEVGQRLRVCLTEVNAHNIKNIYVKSCNLTMFEKPYPEKTKSQTFTFLHVSQISKKQRFPPSVIRPIFSKVKTNKIL